jgi:type IV pilus assembly protein PilC
VRDRVVSGSSLSDAMEREGVFPTVYTASVFAGERSGDLVGVLNRYIRYEKTILTTRKKFRNALIYPAFLIVLSTAMVGVIIGFVIPRFAELYEGFDTQLPVPTQFLLAVAGTVQSSMVVILPLLAATLLAGYLWARSERGQEMLDDLKLRLPVLGSIWTMFSIAQLSRTLATLLEGGIPLLSALGVVRQASGNKVISRAVSVSTGRVEEGMPLSDSLDETGRFPELALEMVRVGEQTGALPEMLNHVADFYDEDVDLKLAALLGWVEPVILIFVAVFVGFILLALYLPIFSLGQSPIF